MAAMLVGLRPAGPRAAARARRRCSWRARSTRSSPTLGSSRLAETDHGADLAIVAEPTLLNLVHCHKGVLRWKIRTRGVACHSSTPHLGVNAIYRMGRVLDALEKYAGMLAAFDARPDSRPAQLSVGRIEGGQSVNVVPDWCEIEVDRRLIPGEDAAIAWTA